MKIARTKKPLVGLPLATMADITFILIFFFLVTSEFAKKGLELQLPAAETATEQRTNPRSIQIDREGRIYLAGVPISMPNLDEEVARFIENAKSEEEKVIPVEGDEQAHYRHIIAVLDIINKHGGYPVLISEAEVTPGEDAASQ